MVYKCSVCNPPDERVGNLAVVVSDAALVPALKSQLTWIVRGMYSNPPAHGARVVANVLADQKLFDEWWVADSFYISKAKNFIF